MTPGSTKEIRVVNPATEATAGYKNRIIRRSYLQPIGQDRPAFSPNWVPYMLMSPTVRLGFQMRIGPLAASEWQVQADIPEIAAFVDNTLRRVWDVSMPVLQTAEAFGHVGAEVVYEIRDGLMQFRDILDFGLWDSQPLEEPRTADVAGVYVKQGVPIPVRLEGMKGFWFHVGTSSRDKAGESILAPAFSPWLDLELPFGLEAAARLWYTKNPFSGMVIRFPDGYTPVIDANGNPTGDKRRNEDIALEYATNALAGAVMALPSTTDERGNPAWEVVNPTANPPPEDLLEERREKKRDIWRGMGIPDEMIVAQESGSGFAGRRVPAGVMKQSLTMVRTRFWDALKRQIMDRLVWWNFGPGHQYEVTFDPISDGGEQPMDPTAEAGAAPQGPNAMPQEAQPEPKPQEFALGDRLDRLERIVGDAVRSLLDHRSEKVEAAVVGLKGQQMALSAERSSDAAALLAAVDELKAVVRAVQPAAVNVTVPERAVTVNTPVTVPERSLNVDARTTVEAGAVKVGDTNVNAPVSVGDLKAKIDANLFADIKAAIEVPPRPPTTAEFTFSSSPEGVPREARGVLKEVR